jgi:hypothetical protein
MGRWRVIGLMVGVLGCDGLYVSTEVSKNSGFCVIDKT